MSNYRFTGGQNFTGTEEKLHHLLMSTELNNGYGAYQPIYAGGKSGISFGGNQMDLAHCTEEFLDSQGNKLSPVKIFTNIMRNSGLFTANELTTVTDPATLSQTGRSPDTVFGDLRERVDQALSSDYGRRKIDEVYESAIIENVRHTKACVEYIWRKGYKEAVKNNEEMMLRLMDYNNQFRLYHDGSMIAFLNGDKVTFTRTINGQKMQLVLELKNPPTVDDVIAFIRATEQYNKNKSGAKGVETRLKKLADYFGTPLSEHGHGSLKLDSALSELEVGSAHGNSLSGKCTLYKHTLSIRVDTEKMVSLNARITYDDYAWLTVNGKAVFESIPGLANGYSVEEKDGVRMIKTLTHEVYAESNRVDIQDIDLTTHVSHGVNVITLSVIVEAGGLAHLKLNYN